MYLVPCAIYGIIQCIKFLLVIMSEPGCHYGTDPMILKFRQKKKSLHVFWFIWTQLWGKSFYSNCTNVNINKSHEKARKPGSLDEEKLIYNWTKLLFQRVRFETLWVRLLVLLWRERAQKFDVYRLRTRTKIENPFWNFVVWSECFHQL